jgi:hypothetical protein
MLSYATDQKAFVIKFLYAFCAFCVSVARLCSREFSVLQYREALPRRLLNICRNRTACKKREMGSKRSLSAHTAEFTRAAGETMHNRLGTPRTLCVTVRKCFRALPKDGITRGWNTQRKRRKAWVS